MQFGRTENANAKKCKKNAKKKMEKNATYKGKRGSETKKKAVQKGSIFFSGAKKMQKNAFAYVALP